MNSGDIIINGSIFQADSVSPILFCVALIPLSKLNNTGYDHKIYDNTISHLFYMHDLKLFAKNYQQLQGLLDIVKQFSDDIRMEFGPDECAKSTFYLEKLRKAKKFTLDNTAIIKDLKPKEIYKYLVLTESDGIQHFSKREKFLKEYFCRVRSILRSKLNACNKIHAINSLVLSVVTYSFTIINWSLIEIKNIDTKIVNF